MPTSEADDLPSRLIKIDEAALRYRTSRSSIYRALREGKITKYKVRSGTRIDVREADSQFIRTTAEAS